MHGQLSPELGRLYRLKRLDLGGAVGLTGSIEALRNATLLQELNLSHCQVPQYDVTVSNRFFLETTRTCFNNQLAISFAKIFELPSFSLFVHND